MKPAFFAVLSFAAAVFLAATIDARSYTPGESGAVSDPLFLALGSAKEAVGDTLFLRADEYFHGGVLEKNHHDESAEDVEREGILPPENGAAPVVQGDWIDGINRQIHATQEKHLEKEKRKEMLPFFKWATELDPHNIEAILTTAFWLDKEFDKPGEAMALLETGVRDNPTSWELESELAKSHLKVGDKASAEAHLKAALSKSAGQDLEDFQRRGLENQIKELTKSLRA